MPTLSNAHALIVGIANYQHISALPESVLNDAQAVHDLLVNPNFCAYPPENVKPLLDGDAARTALLDALDDLAERVDQDAIVFIYMSMHGGRIAKGDDVGEYLLPVDAGVRSDAELDPDTAISSDEFSAALQHIPARKVTVVLDCCHAGGIGDTKGELVTLPFKKGLSEAAYEKTRGW